MQPQQAQAQEQVPWQQLQLLCRPQVQVQVRLEPQAQQQEQVQRRPHQLPPVHQQQPQQLPHHPVGCEAWLCMVLVLRGQPHGLGHPLLLHCRWQLQQGRGHAQRVQMEALLQALQPAAHQAAQLALKQVALHQRQVQAPYWVLDARCPLLHQRARAAPGCHPALQLHQQARTRLQLQAPRPEQMQTPVR